MEGRNPCQAFGAVHGEPVFGDDADTAGTFLGTKRKEKKTGGGRPHNAEKGP